MSSFLEPATLHQARFRTADVSPIVLPPDVFGARERTEARGAEGAE